MPVLPSYRNQSTDLLCCANQLTGFFMRATLAFNGLSKGKVSSLENKKKNQSLTKNHINCK